MSPFDVLRWLEYESRRCHDRDAHEALCLLLPALLDYQGLPPIEDDTEADAFRYQLMIYLRRQELNRKAA